MVERNGGAGYITQRVYAPSGQKLAIMNGQSLAVAFVPLTGGSAAEYHANGIFYYRHSDHLGSSRFVSTTNRTMYSDTAYAPFGEPYAQAGVSDLSFTGMNQDTVSGLYDFPAREYSIQGRWMTPDPAGIAAVDPANPQSWNRYAYVLNNPLALVDPLGLNDCPDDKSTCGDDPGTDTGAPGVDLFGGGGPGSPIGTCGLDQGVPGWAMCRGRPHRHRLWGRRSWKSASERRGNNHAYSSSQQPGYHLSRQPGWADHLGDDPRTSSCLCQHG
jgi:RHS repeat-associated protein